MDEREDSKILRRRDEEHVSIFKARTGMGAVIMEGQEIGAVVRYIEALERDAGRRTTPDRDAIIEECASYLDRKWDSAAALLRSLKTTPTTAPREEGNG
ncbi:hypothetical protein [Burkholderia pseudomultivorans]|uniref:hypothetical protein n=1 Tax=Burkholderia pseudomultivorans TaxID=1207504 RepID=UPI000841BABB|nr:hypothetical protein [Burkholderia pseudomultivorans]AOI92074.1 hypothetical protein WS57_25520 [Burkholderia pseudomultivorans]